MHDVKTPADAAGRAVGPRVRRERGREAASAPSAGRARSARAVRLPPPSAYRCFRDGGGWSSMCRHREEHDAARPALGGRRDPARDWGPGHGGHVRDREHHRGTPARSDALAIGSLPVGNDSTEQRVLLDAQAAAPPSSRVELTLRGSELGRRRCWARHRGHPAPLRLQGLKALALPFGSFDIIYVDDTLRVVRTNQGYWGVNVRDDFVGADDDDFFVRSSAWDTSAGHGRSGPIGCAFGRRDRDAFRC